MNWFLAALAPHSIWGVSNYIDKYLLQKYFRGQGLGALVIFSSLIYIFVLPVILIFQPDILSIQPFYALILMFGGILDTIAILTYLYALQEGETSGVVAIFQTIPVFLYILGFIFLGETLTGMQMLGSALILGGAVAISLNLNHGLPKLKTNILLLMLMSSFLIAVNNLIFKFSAIEESYWTANFWSLSGDTLVGIFFIVFIKNYRSQFLNLFAQNKLPILGLNVFNEIINMAAYFIFRFATLLAPLALVQTVGGFQPLFIFIYGVILTLFFPNIISENLSLKNIVQKLLAITVMFAGTYIINL